MFHNTKISIYFKDGLNDYNCSLPSIPCKNTPNFGCSDTSVNGTGKCQCQGFSYKWDDASQTCVCAQPDYVANGDNCGKNKLFLLNLYLVACLYFQKLFKSQIIKMLNVVHPLVVIHQLKI